MFGILAGTLNGAAFGRDVVDFNADDTSVTNTGHFILAIDIEAFCDAQEFKREIDSVWAEMKSSPLLPGFEEIRLPGERSHNVEVDRRANGVPIHEALDKALATLAGELGIEAL